jgi:hypothetical protein
VNADAHLQADRDQIARFVDALFRYADEGSYVSLRAFYDDANDRYDIRAHRLSARVEKLVDAAATFATEAARAGRPVVFAPPIATFSNATGAAESDLQNGLTLSVECDQNPNAARMRLEDLLGPATIEVASGGEWPNPETGELEPKLHLHWRLAQRNAAQLRSIVPRNPDPVLNGRRGDQPDTTPAGGFRGCRIRALSERV